MADRPGPADRNAAAGKHRRRRRRRRRTRWPSLGKAAPTSVDAGAPAAATEAAQGGRGDGGRHHEDARTDSGTAAAGADRLGVVERGVPDLGVTDRGGADPSAPERGRSAPGALAAEPQGSGQQGSGPRGAAATGAGASGQGTLGQGAAGRGAGGRGPAGRGGHGRGSATENGGGSAERERGAQRRDDGRKDERRAGEHRTGEHRAGEVGRADAVAGARAVGDGGDLAKGGAPRGERGRGERPHGEREGPREPRRGRHRDPDGPPLYAALDLGTNNCRLLVAEPWHQSFRVVDAFSRIVRLGEGLSRSGRLSEAAQDRAIDALRVCRAKLESRGIVRSRLVATEACRSAENGPAFLDRVREEAGLSLEILTRETEARLAVAGCANLIDWTADGVLLFDIGGGSSELVWLEFGAGRRHGGDPTRHIRSWTSLPVGVVTLSERHGGVAVGESVFEDMVADVAALIDEHADWRELDERLMPERYHMLGTSGTVTTLAGVHLGLTRYDRRRVDGTWLGDDDVARMIGQLLAMDFADRVANPCIGGDRADLVLAGCAILEAIHRRWRCDRLRVADRGLREGMLTELMIDDGVWRRGNRWPRRG